MSTHATHSYLPQEKKSFTEYINDILKDDPDLKDVLPMNPDSENLFTTTSKGILLCKLINRIKPGTIKEKICLKQNPNPYERIQNHVIALAACKNLNLVIVNIGAKDLDDGIPHLILGVIWQLLRFELLSHINVQNHPELSQLMNDSEDVSRFVELTPEDTLLRWINFHLKRSGHHRQVTNFSQDLKDSENYIILLNSIAPEICFREGLNEPDLEKRAEIMLQSAEKLGCRKFLSPRDVVNGDGKLNLAFAANLFNKHPAIEATSNNEAKEREMWKAFEAKMAREEAEMKARIEAEYHERLNSWQNEEKERRSLLQKEETNTKEHQSKLEDAHRQLQEQIQQQQLLRQQLLEQQRQQEAQMQLQKDEELQKLQKLQQETVDRYARLEADQLRLQVEEEELKNRISSRQKEGDYELQQKQLLLQEQERKLKEQQDALLAQQQQQQFYLQEQERKLKEQQDALLAQQQQQEQERKAKEQEALLAQQQQPQQQWVGQQYHDSNQQQQWNSQQYYDSNQQQPQQTQWPADQNFNYNANQWDQNRQYDQTAQSTLWPQPDQWAQNSQQIQPAAATNQWATNTWTQPQTDQWNSNQGWTQNQNQVAPAWNSSSPNWGAGYQSQQVGWPQQDQTQWQTQQSWVTPQEGVGYSSSYSSYQYSSVDQRQNAQIQPQAAYGYPPQPYSQQSQAFTQSAAYTSVVHTTTVVKHSTTVFGGTHFYQHIQNRLSRDYYIILDKSGSMAGSLWKQAKAALVKLAHFACRADPDGISLYLFSSPTSRHPVYENIRDASEVERIFNSERASGSTDLAGVLRQAFNDHFKDQNRPTTILVITDGTPDSEPAVKAEIVKAANRITHDHDLSVTFIQIGSDSAATRFLKNLDDNLNAKFDIVDRVTSDQMNGMSFEQLINLSIDD